MMKQLSAQQVADGSPQRWSFVFSLKWSILLVHGKEGQVKSNWISVLLKLLISNGVFIIIMAAFFACLPCVDADADRLVLPYGAAGQERPPQSASPPSGHLHEEEGERRW